MCQKNWHKQTMCPKCQIPGTNLAQKLGHHKMVIIHVLLVLPCDIPMSYVLCQVMPDKLFSIPIYMTRYTPCRPSGGNPKKVINPLLMKNLTLFEMEWVEGYKSSDK